MIFVFYLTLWESNFTSPSANVYVMGVKSVLNVVKVYNLHIGN